MSQRVRLLLGLFFAICAGSMLRAQTANISGTILDPSGTGIPDAKVTVKGIGTGTVRTASSDQTGFYSVPNLLVGQYNVTIDKSGFQALNFQNVTLTVAQNLTLGGTLAVGAVTQSVDVAGTAVPTVDLEDAQISNLVTERQIMELPLITRDPYSLVLLSPGTEKTNTSNGGFSVNGQRDRNNNFMLDGVDNNDASVPGIPGGISTINPDSTQEFRVITNNFLPEFGRNTGAVVDIVTKSGSNSWHGTAYDFNRVRALAARDYFNPTPEPQDPFVFNNFGASLGGPIVKDKTFFFVNGDWTRLRESLPNSSIVPTAAFKTGIFTYDGQQINLASPSSPNNLTGASLSPTVQKILAAYPLPNGPAVDDIRGEYLYQTSLPTDDANTTFRVDHRFNDKYSFYARYIYNGQTNANSTDEIFPGVGGIASTSQGHNIALNFIATIKPTLVNEFRAGVNRTDDVFTCNGTKFLDQFSTPDQFGNGTDYSFSTNTTSTIAGFGCTALGDSDGQARRAGTWDTHDQLSWIAGNHSIKAGVEYRYVYDNGFDAFNSRPTVDFTAFANFGIPVVGCSGACASDQEIQTLGAALLGLVGIQGQTQFFNAQGDRTPTDFRKFAQREYGVFFQDQWKIRSNLTLSYGLRYEYDGVPFELHGNLSNLLYQQAGDPGPITFQTVGPGTGRQLYFGDPLDFEPRAGLAWDPFKDGKTSVRIGYGIFHDRIFGNIFGNLTSNPPFSTSFQAYPNNNYSLGIGGPVTLEQVPTPASLPAPSAAVDEGSYLTGVTVLSRDIKTPYTQSWNVGIQRQLAHQMSVEVNYVGSGSHRLLRSVDGNPPLPSLVAAYQAAGLLDPTISGSALRILPLYGLPQVTGNTVFEEPVVIKTIGNATYNSLQAGFNKQFSKGVQFQANYTWAHAIDDAADPLTPALNNRSIARNSFNLQEERGSSDYDLRHRLVLNFDAELPFGPGHEHLNHGILAHVLGGWELSGISSMQSGQPFTIYSTRDSEYTGLGNRPDIVGDPSIPAGSPANQVGPPITAFAIQPFGRAGNLGRNVFTGPRYFDTDANLVKNNHITERVNLQFRAEVFNIFNRVQFSQPQNSTADGSTFGQTFSTISQPDGTTSARQIQLALKLLF